MAPHVPAESTAAAPDIREADAGGSYVRQVSEVVTSPADRVACRSEDRQDRSDHHRDDADRPDDSDFGDETDDEKNDTENDQGSLLEGARPGDANLQRAGTSGISHISHGPSYHAVCSLNGSAVEGQPELPTRDGRPGHMSSDLCFHCSSSRVILRWGADLDPCASPDLNA